MTGPRTYRTPSGTSRAGTTANQPRNPETADTMSNEILESIKHWRALAKEALDFAAYEESRGAFGGVFRNKADTYERTARSLELELATGKGHCVCCLKPGKSHGVTP